MTVATDWDEFCVHTGVLTCAGSAFLAVCIHVPVYLCMCKLLYIRLYTSMYMCIILYIGAHVVCSSLPSMPDQCCSHFQLI